MTSTKLEEISINFYSSGKIICIANVEHGLSFFEMGEVKNQEWQWNGFVQTPEISIRKKLVGQILSF